MGEVELIAGWVPCQPFSRAGQAKMRELVRSGVRTRDDARAGLWRSFMTVVERFRPPAVLVENVPELPSWDDGSVLSGLLEALAGLGYAVDARIVDCFRHGVPQHRAGAWGSFCTALAKLGHTVADIDAVLITHHHPDHAGTAERLRLAGAQAYSHPADAP